MDLFDPHVHMSSRTTDDYAAMAAAGIRAVVEPAFRLGQPRTRVGSFEDYFLSLLGWERFRARQFGIHHFCAIGLNPKEANDARLAAAVMELLPIYLEKDGVVALGEIGYDDMSAAEHELFAAQLRLARDHGLPVLIHTPERDKLYGTLRILELLRELEFPPKLALVDHNNELTVAAVLEAGCWAGHSIYPDTELDERRMVELVARYGPERILVNSAADWGVSDPLKVAKTAAAMREAGFGDDLISQVVWHNPIQFFAQSGRLEPATLGVGS